VDHALEQCDDGNTIDGDGCDAYCQTEVCGDGAIDLGEQCDDGNTATGDGCSSTCLSEGSCGNGWTDAGEGCDDSNTFDDDGCSSACQIVPVHVANLRVLGDTSTLAWDPAVAPLRRYDVLRGDLAELRTSGGDLGQPGSVCLATTHPLESAVTSPLPAAGQAFYYLVRIDPDWPAAVTWEPSPPAPGATAQRDTFTTPCD
jgi:cysteine-rich repeat protein